MVFSSTLFLFLFLPVVLTGHLLLPPALRNLWLLAASLLFYAWGEPVYVLLMAASIATNYPLGLLVDRWRGRSRFPLGLAVAFNVALLALFKYANFVVATANQALAWLGRSPDALQRLADVLKEKPIPLPIGISFFTFHAISYVVDVHRKDTQVQRNPLRLALYVCLFPQLIAGPIVRYRDIASQISRRIVTTERFAYGVRRFIVGLGKKVLVANIVAVPADRIFALATGDLHPTIAWLGALCYTVQIYFDFSGYSDMAIGIGEMLGFTFKENFRHPYVAQSVRDFWRRWHISLSTWFRDYLFIPMGGSRGPALRTHLHLVTVFFLCGLWHGASWSFVVWGLYHGLFLVLERTAAGAALARMPRPLRHVYVMLVTIVGWVIFRAESLCGALGMLRGFVATGHGAVAANPLAFYLTNDVALALFVGAIGAMPILPALGKILKERQDRHCASSGLVAFSGEAFAVLGLLAIFFASAMALSAQTHNPFIYYRF